MTEMTNMNNTVATPKNTPITVVSHNKYGDKVFRAFGAYTVVGADGKKKYIPAHLEARGIGNEQVARIAMNEYVRKEYGATVFFYSRDIKGVREGCYFKEVTPEAQAPAPESVPTAHTAPATPSAKGARILVTGSNTAVLENKEFKQDVHALIMKAKSAGASAVEFVNNGSLGFAFVEFGKRMFVGYQPKGLQVYTCIVADGIHKDFFATVDVGTTPDPEPTPEPPVDPEPTPEPKAKETVADIPAAPAPETTEEVVRFYTDGSAKGSGENRRAGWAWVCSNGSKANGNLGNATNNVAELTAIKEALSFAVNSLGVSEVEIISDSKYAIGVISGEMNSRVNKEVIAEAQKLMEQVKVTFTWCKGHAGNPLNEEVDKLAKAGADDIIYNDDLEREEKVTELDAQDPTETPAEVNHDDTTKEVMPTDNPTAGNSATTVTETVTNAESTSVESPETDAQVSPNEGDTSQDLEVSNAAAEKSADTEDTKKSISTYCCKKEVEAKDFWPETPSGKTEDEVWDLINGIANQDQQ